MKLYMTPFACSQAPHIALNEAGLAFDTMLVDIPTRRTATGDDFTAVNPKGYVPALVLDDGEILTENVAILAWIAEQAPGLVPPGPLGRIRMIELIGFLTEEVHKPFLIHMFWPGEEAKAVSLEALQERFAYLATTLKGDYALGDTFSAADAMLFVMLSWARQHEMPLDPRLVSYLERVAARPAVARTIERERKAMA
jgi:glutathione S-transferase